MPRISIKMNALHRGQSLIIQHSRRFNIGLCGRRYGKTDLSIRLIVEAGLRGELVGLFAPQFKDVEKTWDKVREALEGLTAKRDEAKKMIWLINGGLIEFWSLKDISQQDSGRGRDYNLVIYDESQKVNTNVFQYNWEKVVRQTLVTKSGKAWFFGTPPNSRTHFFYTLYCRGAINNPKSLSVGGHARDCEIAPEIYTQSSEDWISFRAPSKANPILPPSEIEAMRRELPSFVFAQEVECRFVESSGQMFLQALQDETIAARVFSRTLPLDKSLPLTLSFDFNNRVMAAVLFQHTPQFREVRAIKEFGATDRSKVFSIYDTLNQIKQYIHEQFGVKVGLWDKVNHGWHLPNSIRIVGDATGRAVSGQTQENHSWYSIIEEQLGLKHYNGAFEFLRKSNPTHEKSFIQCNLYLEKHTNIYVDAKACARLKTDMYSAQMSAEGGIDKKLYDPHYLDCYRYFFNSRLEQIYQPK